MVDQTSVKSASNGHTSVSPPQAVARSSMEFLHDLITLVELQAKLIGIDVQAGLPRVILSLTLLLFGICLALACLPLCLAVMALAIAEYWQFSLSQAFGIAVLAGLLIAALSAGIAVLRLRQAHHLLDRSTTEWRQNMRWAKQTLRRLSNAGSRN